MHINFGWINEIISSAGGHLVGETIKKIVVETWAPKVGETLGDYSADWIAFRVAGPKVADERKYKDAVERLGVVSPNDLGTLEHRLAQLSSREQDRYRVIIMRDDIEQMVNIMLGDAQRPDDEWEEHVRIMNLRLQEDEGRFARFTEWCETHLGELWEDLTHLNTEIGHIAARIAAGNDLIREELEARRHETPFESVTRSFRNAMAPPWRTSRGAGRGPRGGGMFNVRMGRRDDEEMPEGGGRNRRSCLGIELRGLPTLDLNLHTPHTVDFSVYRQRQDPPAEATGTNGQRNREPREPETPPAGTRRTRS